MKRIISLTLGLTALAALMTTPLAAQEILTLDDCLSIAKMRNTTVVNAGHQQTIALAGRKTAYSNIMPRLNGGLSARHSVIGPTKNNSQVVQGVEIGGGDRPARTSNSHSFSTTVNQTIYDGGAWWNQIKQSNQQIKASDLDYETSLITVTNQVKSAYYELLKDKKQLDVFRESQILREEQLRRSETMYRVGSVAQIDVFRSKVALNQVRIQILNQQTQIDNSKASLNMSMGRDQSLPVDVVTIEPQVRPLAISKQQVLALARNSHPSIRAGEHDVAAAGLGVKVAKSGWLPSITARGGYTRNNSELTRVYRSFDKNYNWYMNANINFNIWDGNRTSGNVQRTQAQENITRQNHRRAILLVERDVIQAINNYQSNLEKIDLYEDNLVEAAETMRLAEGRYQQGAGTLLEIIDAQENLTSARIQLVRAQYDAETYKARLESAIGSDDSGTMLFH
jgi:outer membrane protein